MGRILGGFRLSCWLFFGCVFFLCKKHLYIFLSFHQLLHLISCLPVVWVCFFLLFQKFSVFDGASSDTAFFENHRSTICFRGHRIATCLYRTPMGGCIEKTVAFYIPHNLKIIKYAQRSLLPSPGANGRCFFCLQRKEASVKWQCFG